MTAIAGGLPFLPLRHHCHDHLSRFYTLLPARNIVSSFRTCARSKIKLPPLLAVGGESREKEMSKHAQPDECYDDDDEWQAQQREKSKQWQAYRQKEEEEENRKIDEYREIGMRLKGYAEEEVQNARILVSGLIRSANEVEEKIEEAGEKGELTELVLMVILNRLDLARRDEEKDAIRCLDLLYRRIEAEILKRESSPAMNLLNELLNLYDGYNDDGWLKECRKRMVETFPREDPFSMLVPEGFDMDNHDGRIELPEEDEDILLRVDFVRELDSLLKEVRAEQSNAQTPAGLDAESVANRLKQQEKQRTIHQVEALLELAINLQW